MNDPRSPASQDLRRRAQERIKLAPVFLHTEDPLLALHELRVYQAELEIQNEELIAARVGLESSHKKYFRHFDLAPVGLIRLSSDAIVLETNILAAQMLGVNRKTFDTRPQCFILNVAAPWHLDFQQHLESALASGKMETCELVLHHPSGEETFVRLQSVRSHSEGEAIELYVTITDLSERRKVERRLVLQQAELTAEMATRSNLEREVLTICEREQCRLGMDLHDDLGQQLAGVALLGKVLSDKLHKAGNPDAGDAQTISNYCRGLIDVARNLAKGLYPIDLAQDGLLSSITNLTNQTRQHFQIDCAFRQIGPVPTFDRAAEIHLYRIIQESIGNAIKHGRARSILVESITHDGLQTLSVTDDGVGLSGSHDHVPGIGLRLMQYRARLIHATVDVESPQAGGCRVVCRLIGYLQG